MIEWANWPAPETIVAGVVNRKGGVGAGAYATNNFSMHVGDDPSAVMTNRNTLSRKLEGHPSWSFMKQVHGIRMIPLPFEGEQEADASYSFDRGVVSCVMTADCLPVLLTDKNGNFVSALHAGWRGLAAGIIEQVLAGLEQQFQARRIEWQAGNILAWIGPAISKAHFEVGEEVREAFVGRNKEAETAFSERGGKKYACDLFQLARQCLNNSGIQAVFSDEICTYANPDRFFSYRRDGKPSGRFVSFIYKRAV